MTETLRARELRTTATTAISHRHRGICSKVACREERKNFFPPHRKVSHRTRKQHGDRRRRRRHDARFLPARKPRGRLRVRPTVPRSQSASRPSVKGDREEKREIELFLPFATRMPSGATGETNERTTWKMLDSWMDVKKAIKRRPYETWEWKSAFCLLPRGKVSPAVN